MLPDEKAVNLIKGAIQKAYGRKGEEVVQMNLKAVDNTLAHLHEVSLTGKVNGTGPLLPPVTTDAPVFVRDVLGMIAGGLGDDLPVSAFPKDGTFPTDTGLFVGLLIGVILIVGGLTFFPALSLGPIVEQLLQNAGKTF